jgi:hypothetical protein
MKSLKTIRTASQYEWANYSMKSVRLEIRAIQVPYYPVNLAGLIALQCWNEFGSKATSGAR